MDEEILLHFPRDAEVVGGGERPRIMLADPRGADVVKQRVVVVLAEDRLDPQGLLLLSLEPRYVVRVARENLVRRYFAEVGEVL